MRPYKIYRSRTCLFSDQFFDIVIYYPWKIILFLCNFVWDVLTYLQLYNGVLKFWPQSSIQHLSLNGLVWSVEEEWMWNSSLRALQFALLHMWKILWGYQCCFIAIDSILDLIWKKSLMIMYFKCQLICG